MTTANPLKILFLHGLEGTPNGSKPTHLSEAGHLVVAPVLGKDDFNESLKIAESCAKEHNPDIIVGSSRGGAVAMCKAEAATVSGLNQLSRKTSALGLVRGVSTVPGQRIPTAIFDPDP